jgi:hypothetical protein
VGTVNQIDEYLKQVIVRNGSDLHFIAGEPPRGSMASWQSWHIEGW